MTQFAETGVTKTRLDDQIAWRPEERPLPKDVQDLEAIDHHGGGIDPIVRRVGCTTMGNGGAPIHRRGSQAREVLP